MPDRVPGDMPDSMPERMPEDMPDRMPDRMPEDMSDRMPEDLPVTKCINVMVGITRSKVFFIFFYIYKTSCLLTTKGVLTNVKIFIIFQHHRTPWESNSGTLWSWYFFNIRWHFHHPISDWVSWPLAAQPLCSFLSTWAGKCWQVNDVEGLLEGCNNIELLWGVQNMPQ